ncbi:MAG TPA: alkaline phosphatase family protein [Terriglobales bacterium]|nr:alkaline phosphatase family protein [Terriglobales bacterium]
MLLDRLVNSTAVTIALFLVASLMACGGGVSSSGNAPASSPVPGVASPVSPQAGSVQGTVVMVIEENHSYEQVIGNASMPYLNGLAQQGALAQQYYASMHPSLPNYFDLTTGATQTTDNNWPGPVSADNLARELNAAGRSWKVYAEDLPSPGYLGNTTGNYIKHHNPFAYFTDVINDPNQAANIVPFSQFAGDVNAGRLPTFSLVIPNLPDDAHSCATGVTCDDNSMLATADQWLKNNLAPLLAGAQFQRNGLLLITFDESNLADLRNGGGRVPLIAVGPKAKAGAQSTVVYRHQNTLKTVCALLGITYCPGGAASAAVEDDLIQH